MKLSWLISLTFLVLADGYGQTAKSKKSSSTVAEKKAAPSSSKKKADSSTSEKKTESSVPTKKADSSGSADSTDAPSEAEEVLTEGPEAKNVKRVAAVSTIEPEELVNFSHYAPQIQQLIRNALDLTKLNLTYTFGASNPTEGGMDCSGTMVHLLQGLGMKGVPRQSDEICGWVQDRTLLHRINEADSLTHVEFSALQPGDLLFWSGTYATAPRKIPVTHVMLYLGKMKKGGKHVVFGASDGRFYQGQRRTGVSVFDFSLPKAGSKTTFYGYGLIPGIGKVEAKPLDPVTIAMATVDKVVPPPDKKPLEAKDGVAPLKTGDAAKTKDGAVTKKESSATEKTDDNAAVAEAKSEEASKNKADTVVTAGKNDTEAKTLQEEVEIRRATPATVEPTEVAANKPKSTEPKASGNVTKKATAPKATTKPKSSSSKARTSAQRRSPPPPPTAQQKFESAANRVANSFRNAFSN